VPGNAVGGNVMFLFSTVGVGFQFCRQNSYSERLQSRFL